MLPSSNIFLSRLGAYLRYLLPLLLFLAAQINIAISLSENENILVPDKNITTQTFKK